MGLRRGFVFSKNKLLGSASRASPRRVNATTGPRRDFCAGAFLMAFSLGYPVLPTHGSILSRPDGCLHWFTTGRPETNLRNESENIVRTEEVKIVTRYTIRREQRALGRHPSS
jgi:hypothetical protein